MKQIYIFLVCLLASISMNAQDKEQVEGNREVVCLSSKTIDDEIVTEEDLITVFRAL